MVALSKHLSRHRDVSLSGLANYILIKLGDKKFSSQIGRVPSHASGVTVSYGHEGENKILYSSFASAHLRHKCRDSNWIQSKTTLIGLDGRTSDVFRQMASLVTSHRAQCRCSMLEFSLPGKGLLKTSNGF